ncbi:Uncharacterized protein Fot_13847 [Forsythia ovata]|uniref:DUF4283 domain-containing protein n=1 Tax=Forsythia ovata TaxID=205694 RepID=A0ABD1W4P3_9LAMI
MALDDNYAKLSLEDEEQGVNCKGMMCYRKMRNIVTVWWEDSSQTIPSNLFQCGTQWHPFGGRKKGYASKILGLGIYIFQFFHQLDMDRILHNGPWTIYLGILLHSSGEKWLRSSSSKISNSKYGKDVTEAMDEELSMQEGVNDSVAIKGNDVNHESVSINLAARHVASP